MIVLLASTCLLLASCSPSPRVPSPQSPPQAGAQANVNTPGVFTGTLPCADCPGIRTELTLNAPASPGGDQGTYTLRQTYLGTPDGDRTFDTGGRWTLLRGSAPDPN